MRIFVTGSTGFVGTSLIGRLIKDQFSVSASLRHVSRNEFNTDVNLISIGHMTPSQDWIHALQGIDVVIHLAARSHILNDRSKDPLAEYRYTNVDCTLNLAKQAAKVGVKRFIYVSSVKVNGEVTMLGAPFTPQDIPMPQDFYGLSKYEAELGLREITEEFGMELVVIRSPLIYGPGVKANFLSMMNWLMWEVPLPFGAVTKNQRSFVFLENIIDAIVICINHPKAANQTFMVSDDEDMSTAALLKRMASALGRPSRLISVSEDLMNLGAKIIGRSDISMRLCGSLQIDITKTKNLLGWLPPFSVEEGFHSTADHFLKKRS